MALIVTIDVLARGLFGHPLKGGPELVEQLMVCYVFLLIPYVTAKRKHIRVDAFIPFLARKVPQVLWAVTLAFDIIILAIVALLAWQGFAGSITAFYSGEVTDALRIPHYPFRIVLACGFTVTFFSYLANLIPNFPTKGKGLDNHVS